MPEEKLNAPHSHSPEFPSFIWKVFSVCALRAIPRLSSDEHSASEQRRVPTSGMILILSEILI